MGREGIALIVAGLALGVMAMVPLESVVKKYVFDAAALTPALYAAALAILLAVGAVAVVVPGLRAARIDPIRILRGE